MSLFVHDLSVGEIAPDAPVVIAVHGITANGLCWPRFAAALASRHPGVRVLAPDLRGRAETPAGDDHPGLSAHVADLVELAGRQSSPPVFVGHSLGAFVCALLAGQHPEVAAAGVVLVDGGLSFSLPPGLDVDATLAAVLGPSLARLSMSFPDEQALLDFVATNPALAALLAGPLGEAGREYLRHDMVHGDDGLVRSSCSEAAVRADGRDLLVHPSLPGAVREAITAGVPMEFLWASRGLFDEPRGMYDEARLAAMALPEALTVTHVPDTNHFSIVFGDDGIAAIIDAVERLLGPPRRD
ncbi:MAG: alpha/beta hydrolase [Candidatus Phosphoribacter sp.]|nr:alpha/beta fold hydrolase [Actinomycetales bacterium]